MKDLNNQNFDLKIINSERPQKSNILSGVYLRKEGMTRVLLNSGVWLSVTVASLVPATILSKLSDKKAMVFVKNSSKLNNPELGIIKKHMNAQADELADISNKGSIKTVDIYGDVSGELSLDQFQLGDMIDVIGNSKGKGFCGTMKRWNHKGGRASHGASLDHNKGGSTGWFQNRSKTKPGVKAAGRLGNDRITMQNLQVVGLCDNILLIAGSVPGHRGSCFYAGRAKKI